MKNELQSDLCMYSVKSQSMFFFHIDHIQTDYILSQGRLNKTSLLKSKCVKPSNLFLENEKCDAK